MKKLLICVNTVLAFLLAISLWGAFSGSNGDKLEVGKKKKRAKSAAAAVVPTPAKFNVPASEEAVSSIVRKIYLIPNAPAVPPGAGGQPTH